MSIEARKLFTVVRSKFLDGLFVEPLQTSPDHFDLLQLGEDQKTLVVLGLLATKFHNSLVDLGIVLVKGKLLSSMLIPAIVVLVQMRDNRKDLSGFRFEVRPYKRYIVFKESYKKKE